MAGTLLDRLAERLTERLTEGLSEGQTDRTRRAPVEINASTPIAVALSGGIDSVVLLATMQRIGTWQRLRCIHVDHRLHADSADWARFCEQLAENLGIEYRCCVVECENRGDGLEAAARDARYAALMSELRDGEVLLTAHHADDQLETLLYRLVRGTGVDGLRGIREFERFGAGYLMRPLLSETRASIRESALAMQLQWREDPSNVDTRFDRNYLRWYVLPALLERWPRAGQAAARFAASAGDAAEIAAALAVNDLEAIDSLDCLPCQRLADLTPARRRNVLRHAVRQLALPMPDAAALARICALLEPEPAHSSVEWPGGEARRHGQWLYLQRAPAAVADARLRLGPEQPCVPGYGRLELERGGTPALPDDWVRQGLSVRYRTGGEQFQPCGSARPVPLREWLRTQGVLPWMRDRLPLIWHDSELVAVADLGISAAAAAAAAEQQAAGGWRIVWHDRPRTHASLRGGT